MAASQLSPALLALVTDFLNTNGYDKAASQVEKQAKKQGVTLEKDAATPSLTAVYESWQSQQTTPVAKESESDSDSSSSEEDSESDSESSDSDSDDKVSRKRKASSPPSDDSSSASDASSSSSESSDESSESEAEVAPPAKKSKTAHKTKAKTPSPAPSSSASSASESSESESDSSSSSDSSSESSESESESESEAEPEPVKPKKSKKSEKASKDSKPAKAAKVEVTTNDSDSSATLAGDSPVDTLVIPAADNSEYMHPDRKRKLPSSFSQTSEEQAVPATEENIKRLKKENIPFSRIPKDQFVDPKFSDNTYQSYDYADKAHEALIVTKGKAFTKAKNKGKRGSYRGGKIDLTPKGIKFED